MNYRKLCKITDSEPIEVGGTFDNGEVQGKIKEVITAEDGTKSVKVETQNEDGDIEEVEVAIEDSTTSAIYQVTYKDPETGEELVEKFTGKDAADDFVANLKDGTYSISKIAFVEDASGMGYVSDEYIDTLLDEGSVRIPLKGKTAEQLFDEVDNIIQSYAAPDGYVNLSYINLGDEVEIIVEGEGSYIPDSSYDQDTFKVRYTDPETGEEKDEYFDGKGALEAAKDFCDNLEKGTYKITKVVDSNNGPLTKEEINGLDDPSTYPIIKKCAKKMGLTEREAASWFDGPNYKYYVQEDLEKGDKIAEQLLGKEEFSKLDPSSFDVQRAIMEKFNIK